MDLIPSSATGEENATYGTARVILAVGAGGPGLRGVEWLLSTQQADGGWGGGAGAAPSIEETAVAVEALAGVLGHEPTGASREPLEAAVCRGVSWLVERTGRGAATAPSPIGLYFARLWYFAPLYPLIFTVSALGRVESLLRSPAAGRSCPNRGAAAKMN